jgi:hypothetical protein
MRTAFGGSRWPAALIATLIARSRSAAFITPIHAGRDGKPDAQAPDAGTGWDEGAPMGDGKIRFYLSPGDLETNVGPDALNILSTSPAVGADFLQLYAAQLSVITWPEGSSVPTTKDIHVPAVYDPSNTASYGKVTVRQVRRRRPSP